MNYADLPDAELNEAVAKKLDYIFDELGNCYALDKAYGAHVLIELPDFLHSMDACEPVKAWLVERGYDIVVRHYIDEVGVELWLRGSPIFVDVRSKDYPNAEPRALCIAFMEVEE